MAKFTNIFWWLESANGLAQIGSISIGDKLKRYLGKGSCDHFWVGFISSGGGRKCPEPDSGLNTSICHLKPLLSLLWKNFPYLGKHQQLQAESCKVVKGEFWLLNIDRQHWTRLTSSPFSWIKNQSFERNPEQSIVYGCISNWFCFGWWPMWGASITAKKYKFSWFFRRYQFHVIVINPQSSWKGSLAKS